MNYERMRFIVAIATVLSGAEAQAQSDTNQMMGTLGYPVGTELTIEAKFGGGKNSWVYVTKVNGQDVTPPKRIATNLYHLDPAIATNTLCRLKGVEITYVVKSEVDPATGRGDAQQAASGRHFDFRVTEILSPEGVKMGKKQSPNKASEPSVAPAPQVQH